MNYADLKPGDMLFARAASVDPDIIKEHGDTKTLVLLLKEKKEEEPFNNRGWTIYAFGANKKTWIYEASLILDEYHKSSRTRLGIHHAQDQHRGDT
jgi:hypothetical protein